MNIPRTEIEEAGAAATRSGSSSTHEDSLRRRYREGTEMVSKGNELVSLRRGTVGGQPPMVLASGNEAVAAVANELIKLSPSQRAFLRLRFYYETDAECARVVGIAPKTVATWKNRDRNFVAVYAELLAQPLLHARAELLLLTDKAIHALGEMLDSPNPQARLAAIDRVLKGRDTQLLKNNLKVESDGDDLYTLMMRRLASRVRTVAPAMSEPTNEVAVDGQYREIEPPS